MKNVMVRAWEIAKAAAVKFGGKVKEYFAQALAMAWAEEKNITEEHFGFTKIKNVNGVLHFAVTDIEGLEVTYLGWKFNLKGDKVDVHKQMDYKTGTEKATGRRVRIYSITMDNVMEFNLNGAKERLNLNRGRLEWV